MQWQNACLRWKILQNPHLHDRFPLCGLGPALAQRATPPRWGGFLPVMCGGSPSIAGRAIPSWIERPESDVVSLTQEDYRHKFESHKAHQ